MKKIINVAIVATRPIGKFETQYKARKFQKIPGQKNS